jgi:protein-L-isoaspartate(D-aspartate) O-methyltransferase
VRVLRLVLGAPISVVMATLALHAAAADGPGGAPRPSPEAAARRHMVASQIEARGIADPRVLEAMRTVERHRFVPDAYRGAAHDDHPLPIGHGQTISQPYIVALMTELARVRPDARVLEIGTGSGYQAAVLAVLAKEVYTIEIVAPLAAEAAERLARLGYRNVTVRAGDGYRGWPEKAPFDAVIVTAAPPEIPQPLLDQLAVGGRLVAPIGPEYGDQRLVVVERTAKGYERSVVAGVRFVPMTGEAQQR